MATEQEQRALIRQVLGGETKTSTFSSDEQERRAQIRAALQQSNTPQNVFAEVDRFLATAPTAQTTADGAPTDERGFFARAAEAITKPVTKVGVSLANVLQSGAEIGAGGIAKLFGQEEAAQRLFGQAGRTIQRQVDLGPLGRVDPLLKGKAIGDTTFGEFAKETIGTGVQTGLTFTGAGGRAGQAALGGIAGRLGVQTGQRGLAGALTGRVAGTALEQAAESAVFEGARQVAEDEPVNFEEIFKAGVTGAVVPVGFAGVSKAVKKFVPETLGKLTGAKTAAIEEAFTNPNIRKFIKEANLDPIKFQDDILDDARAGIGLLKARKSAEYQKNLAKIKVSDKARGEILDTTQNTAKDVMKRFGVKFEVDDAGKVKLDTLDLLDSDIVRGERDVERALMRVFEHTDDTAIGLDRLKRRLESIKQGIPQQERTARKFIEDINHSLKTELRGKVKGYEDMTKAYQNAQNLEDDIIATLSLRSSTKKETAIKKLLSSLRDNQEQRLAMVQQLEKALGKDIKGRVAATQLRQATPGGLAGVLLPQAVGGGVLAGAAGLLNPVVLVKAAAFAAMSSPRLNALFLSVLGQINRKMLETGIPEGIQNALVLLLAQAQREAREQAGPVEDIEIDPEDQFEIVTEEEGFVQPADGQQASTEQEQRQLIREVLGR